MVSAHPYRDQIVSTKETRDVRILKLVIHFNHGGDIPAKRKEFKGCWKKIRKASKFIDADFRTNTETVDRIYSAKEKAINFIRAFKETGWIDIDNIIIPFHEVKYFSFEDMEKYEVEALPEDASFGE